MRKDAKIGFAVGGVLLAVLTVYTVVVPRHPHAASSNAVTLAIPPGSSANNDQPAAGPSAASNEWPVAPAPSTESKSEAARNSSDNVNWAKLLNGSSDAPPLFSTTPTVGDTADKPQPAAPASAVRTASANDACPRLHPELPQMMQSPSAQSPAVIPASVTLVKPATQPAVAGRQYTIKSGQTLSSIAAEVYGNQRFYVAILRANPSVNPARLRPGMKITLPDISEVRPESSVSTAAMAVEEETPKPTHAARTHTSAAAGQTYTVASGDTLYRISKKLYGSQKQADAIYALNKETIGQDKARLKIGMVLTLPDAPTASVTAATR